MFRQHLACCFAQSQCSDRETKHEGIENYSDHEHDPARNNANLGAIDEGVEITRRQRMQIHFEVPAQSEQREDLT